MGKEEIIKNGKKRFSINLSSLRTELIKIAAVVAITLGGSYFYYQSSLEKELMAMQTITVPAGQRINITLVEWHKCLAKCQDFTVISGEIR